MIDTMTPPLVRDLLPKIHSEPPFAIHGRVTRVIGQVVEVSSLEVAVGEVCRIEPDDHQGVLAQWHQQNAPLVKSYDLGQDTLMIVGLDATYFAYRHLE